MKSSPSPRRATGAPQPPGQPDADRDPGQQQHDEQGVQQHGQRDVRRRPGPEPRPDRARGRRHGNPYGPWPGSLAEQMQVQARHHDHGGGYPARAERVQQHPAQLDRGRLLAARPAADEQDHQHGHDHDLEDHADDQRLPVQRAVPPQGAHRPAQPGQPRDDQQRKRQQPQQPVLRRERRLRMIAFCVPRGPRRHCSRLAAGHSLAFLASRAPACPGRGVPTRAKPYPGPAPRLGAWCPCAPGPFPVTADTRSGHPPPQPRTTRDA